MMPTSIQFLLLLTLVYGLGMILPLVVQGPLGSARDDGSQREINEPRPLHWSIRTALGLALLGSLVAFGVSVAVTAGWSLERSTVGLPWINLGPIHRLDLTFHLDRLGAFFALITSGFSALVAVYSFGALRAAHFDGHRHRVVAGFNAFVWSTLLVLLVADCLSMLIALELMSLSFGYLALFKHLLLEEEDAPLTEHERNQRHNARQAPQFYLMASHTSTAFLLVAVSILGLHAGSLGFQEITAVATRLDPRTASLVFLLALAGLGVRLGLSPAHFWVPFVHPASPTPIHALSVGIATKVGVYLMVRFFFQFTEPQVWWGYTLLLVAGFTVLVTIWYAIASHDLKEALAYHSTAHTGIIAMGLGVALIFVSDVTPAGPWIAGLALVAGLYHLLNHAVFKGVLYMATGSIDNLTNRAVEFDRLGGLLRLYPWTSTAFLIGALAISGFPPFNGFISEWLTLQAMFRGLIEGGPLTVAVMLAALILFVASFALTAFCFFKMVGLVLLGEPREDENKLAQWSTTDSPLSMRLPMICMATLCLVLGLLPGLVVPWLAGIIDASGLLPNAFAIRSPFGLPDWASLTLPAMPGAVSSLPMAWLAGTAFVLLVAGGVFSRLGSVRRPAPDGAWNCGTPYRARTMQYTAATLSELIRHELPSGAPPEKTEPGEPTERDRTERIILTDWYGMSKSATNPQWVHEVFRAVYNWLSRRIYDGSAWLGDRVQGGDIRLYIRYILAIQIVILVLFLVLPIGGGPR